MLCVPIPGNLQRGRFTEVVLDQPLAIGFRSPVEKESILSYLSVKVVQSAVIWVDDVVPVTIQRDHLSMVGINQNGSGLGLPVRADGKDGGKDRCQKYAKLRLHQNSVALKFGDRQTTPI